jgi:hypothetical protein
MMQQPQPQNQSQARAKAQARAEEQARSKAEAEARAEAEVQAHLESQLESILTDMGYKPPTPPPLLSARALEIVTREGQTGDPVFSVTLTAVKRQIEHDYKLSYEYLAKLKMSLIVSPAEQWINRLGFRVHQSINQATVSIEIPEVASSLNEKMREIELFLAGNWVKEKHRGVLAIHIDEASQSTILQIGIAEHGPIYITIPGILRPEDMAERSIKVLLNRLPAFHNLVDPMAVINGAHQGLVYNKVFLKTRVIRAPSGNISQLALNVK